MKKSHNNRGRPERPTPLLSRRHQNKNPGLPPGSHHALYTIVLIAHPLHDRTDPPYKVTNINNILRPVGGKFHPDQVVQADKRN